MLSLQNQNRNMEVIKTNLEHKIVYVTGVAGVGKRHISSESFIKSTGWERLTEKCVDLGLSKIEDGSFNLQCRRHLPILTVDQCIVPSDFEFSQTVKLKRCYVFKESNPVDSVRAVIMRPSHHEDPYRHDLFTRLELLSDINIRSRFSINDGDQLGVVVLSEQKGHNCEGNLWELIPIDALPKLVFEYNRLLKAHSNRFI